MTWTWTFKAVPSTLSGVAKSVEEQFILPENNILGQKPAPPIETQIV